jgi:hypothetical protein
LPREIVADRFGDTGFWNSGWWYPHGTDQTGLQILQDLPLLPSKQHPPTFASMAHLSLFHADAPVFRTHF